MDIRDADSPLFFTTLRDHVYGPPGRPPLGGGDVVLAATLGRVTQNILAESAVRGARQIQGNGGRRWRA